MAGLPEWRALLQRRTGLVLMLMLFALCLFKMRNMQSCTRVTPTSHHNKNVVNPDCTACRLAHGAQPQRRPDGPYYVIGWATVRRPIEGLEYNVDTVGNLINSLNCDLGNSTNSGADARNRGRRVFCVPDWRHRVKIVVYNAEYDPEDYAFSMSALRERYGDYIASGNLILLNRSRAEDFRQPLYFTYPIQDKRRLSGKGDAESEDLRRRHARPGEWWYEYPFSKKLKRNYGDPIDQVLWRSKQVLDAMFVMHYALSHVTFDRPDHEGRPDAFIGLEDDVEVVEGVNIAGAVDKLLSCHHCPANRSGDSLFVSLVGPNAEATLVEERVQRLRALAPGFAGAFGFLVPITRDVGRVRALVEALHWTFDEMPLDWALSMAVLRLGSMWGLAHGLVVHRGHVSTLKRLCHAQARAAGLASEACDQKQV